MRVAQCKMVLVAAVFLLLTGCLFQPPDDLYSLPEPPADYQNLYTKIDEVRAAGAEYAGPVQGTNTQPIQLVDLDGDGVQEAVVFFRILGDEQQLQIYIFHQLEDESYEVQSVIKGDGNAIYSVDYENLDDDLRNKELVVSWQISSLVYNLGAYRYSDQEGQYVELMFTSYNRFSLLDIDKDNQKEIMVLNLNSIQGEGQADLFDYDSNDKTMNLRDTAPMSKEIISISAMRNGSVKNGGLTAPALFVTSDLSNGISTITDVFAWRDGRLVNITLNTESGMSESTRRVNSMRTVAARDINRDGILELPRPSLLPAYAKENAESFWSVLWQQYDLQGSPIRVFNTYFNDTEGWYLILPDAWDGVITLAKSNIVSGERATTFYYWKDQDPGAAPQEFLTIYKLTGPNRETRSRTGNRFVLMADGDSTIYAAEFKSCDWDCGLDEEGLRELFQLIQPEWPDT
ncbi:hypothetical protein ACQRBP_14390 [Eubacteriales bacterium SGI.150]